MSISVPTDIAGCEVWLDADDVTTFTFGSGTRVASWTDKSGNAYVFDDVGSGSSNYPERQAAVLNGRAVVDWGLGDRVGNDDDITLSQPFTIFIVAQFDAAPSVDNTLWAGDGTGTHITRRADDSLWVHAGSPAFPANTFAVNNGTPDYFTFLFNGSSSYARISGAAGFTSVDVGSAGINFDMWLGFMPGVGQSLANSGGFIAEFVLYDSALSTGDRDDVEDYLVAKWFTAPSGLAADSGGWAVL